MGAAPQLEWVRIGPAPADANANHCKSTGKNECKLDYPVVLQPLFVLQFDRFLAPSSVARANYSLLSGTSKDLAFKQIRVDPVERAVIFTLEGALQPSVEYKLVIRAADREADRLAAYDGTPFDGTYTIAFTTGSGATVENDVDPGTFDPCAAITVLQGSCLGSNCHGDLVSTPPAMGLSFASYAAIQGTAVGRAASEVQNAAAPRVGSPGAPFPYGMQLIVPNSSAASYLLYKILMDTRLRNGTTVAADTPFPMTTIAQAPQTPNRMSTLGKELSKVIPGTAMPHPDLLPEPATPQVYEPLSIDNIRLLRGWIDRGAPACAPTTGDAGVPDGGSDAALDATDGSTADADAAEGG
ncbi:MAG: hypothetical protein ACXWUG_09760 [Polyangiales bacterium]